MGVCVCARVFEALFSYAAADAEMLHAGDPRASEGVRVHRSSEAVLLRLRLVDSARCDGSMVPEIGLEVVVLGFGDRMLQIVFPQNMSVFATNHLIKENPDEPTTGKQVVKSSLHGLF